MLSVEQLQAFSAVASHGSFSAAARYLRRSQSVVSLHIQNLEKELGILLFDRSINAKPALTELGARLLPEAQTILDRRRHLIELAINLKEPGERKLTVAIDQLYPQAVITRVFAEFSSLFGHVELDLSFPVMEDITSLIIENCVDLGIMVRRNQISPELGSVAVHRAKLAPVCSRRHPLAFVTPLGTSSDCTGRLSSRKAVLAVFRQA